MGGILTLARKDLRLLWRDKAGLFWVLGFPLAIAIFFGFLFGGSGGGGTSAMPIAVVDEDGTEASRAFVERLEKHAALEVQRLPREEAETAVRRGKLVAWVALKSGFGAASDMPFSGGGGGGLPIQVGMDPSRRAEAGYLQGILTQASFQGMQEMFEDPAKMRGSVRKSIAELDAATGTTGPDADQQQNLRGFLGSLDSFLGNVDPQVYKQGPASAGPSIEAVPVVKEGKEPRSFFEISFPQATIWALIGTVASFAISLVKERSDGTFLRLRLSPMTRGRILTGKGLACFLGCAITVTLVLLVGAVVFHVRIGSLGALALAVACSGLGFTGIMMCIATLGRTEQAVAGAGWAILLVMSMIGGGMVPLVIMPAWMRVASDISPVKWAVVAFEGAIWRGFSLPEMLLPCGVLLGVGAVFFALGVANLARRGD